AGREGGVGVCKAGGAALRRGPPPPAAPRPGPAWFVWRPRDATAPGAGGPPLRILMTTSFPLPGEYDGTAMLAIQVFRALRRRGVEVVVAHLKARRPWGRPARGGFEGAPYFTLPSAHWLRRPRG